MALPDLAKAARPGAPNFRRNSEHRRGSRVRKVQFCGFGKNIVKTLETRFFDQVVERMGEIKLANLGKNLLDSPTCF